MKIVKYFFLLLVLAAVALTVFIATQNGKYTIKQEKVIPAPKTVLYGYVNDYKNWGNLNLLAEADSTATYTYSDNSMGKGATMAWQKNGTTGSIQTIKAANNDSISQKATIDGLDSGIKWAFKDTVGGTKVTIKINGELSFSEKASALLQHGRIDKTFEKGIERGLDNLNTFLVSELKKFSFEVKGIVTKKATFYLGQNITSTRAEMDKIAAAGFEKLLAFTKENKIKVTGPPFIIYKNFSRSKDTLNYMLSIPIKEEIFTMPGSEYEGGRLKAFNALKTSAKGDYSHLPKAWDAAYKHIIENSLKENPALPYIVYYTKNINDTRRPSAWVSDIYIPIGPALQDAVAVRDTLSIPMPQIPETQTVKPAATNSTARPASTVTKPAIGTKPATVTKPVTQPKPKPKNTTATPVKKDSLK